MALPFFQKIKTWINSSNPLDQFLFRGLLLLLAYLIFYFFIHPEVIIMKSLLQTCSLFLNAVGYDTEIEKNIILLNGKPTIKLIKACLAIKPTIIFIGFIIAYPGKILKKLWFIPIGICTLYIANVIRISIGGIIYLNSPGSFDFYHQYVFKLFFYFFVFALLIYWILFLSKEKILKNKL